jgi:hypothetical protein
MKISSSKKILLEEVPATQKAWFEKIVNVLNPFLDQTYKILTQGLTIGDNIKSQKFSIYVTANQVYPISVSYSLNERPYAVHIAQIQEDVTTNTSVATYGFNWYFENGSIKIFMSGLDSSKAYKVNLYTLI